MQLYNYIKLIKKNIENKTYDLEEEDKFDLIEKGILIIGNFNEITAKLENSFNLITNLMKSNNIDIQTFSALFDYF